MRITAVLAFVLLAGLASPAFAESAFVGTWTATADAPTGKVSETVKVVKTADGYAVTAQLVGAPVGAPEAGPGMDIVLNGDSFSYKRLIGELVINYTGVVTGNTFAGTVEMAGYKLPYNGVRAGETK